MAQVPFKIIGGGGGLKNEVIPACPLMSAINLVNLTLQPLLQCDGQISPLTN